MPEADDPSDRSDARLARAAFTLVGEGRTEADAERDLAAKREARFAEIRRQASIAAGDDASTVDFAYSEAIPDARPTQVAVVRKL